MDKETAEPTATPSTERVTPNNDLLCAACNNKRIPPPTLHEYSTCVGSGTAGLRLFLPGDYTADDIQDFRDWLALIDKQMARLQKPASEDA